MIPEFFLYLFPFLLLGGFLLYWAGLPARLRP